MHASGGLVDRAGRGRRLVLVRLWRWRSEPRKNEPPSTSATQVEPYRRVESYSDVEALAALIFDREREHLVVVLTSRSGQKGPSVDPDEVRAIVGPEAVIYCVPTGPYSRELADRV